MKPSPQIVSPLRQRMLDDMRMRKLSPETQSHYLRAVRQFAGFLHRPPDTASVEDLHNYQLYLVDHGISPVSLNAAITGLKFFFDVTADHPELTAKMQPVHVPQTLPVVLSREEVAGRDPRVLAGQQMRAGIVQPLTRARGRKDGKRPFSLSFHSTAGVQRIADLVCSERHRRLWPNKSRSDSPS